MPQLPSQLERVFTLIEMNAPRVPVFRKFANGEPLDLGDATELEKALRELGLFEFAQFASEVTPEVLTAIGQAHDAFDRARKVRSIFETFFG